jgi:hypothetical protein
MYPINQVILNSDPMASSLDNLDNQIQLMENYRNKLSQLKQQQVPQKLIWDEIDAEIIPLTKEQKEKLLNDREYADTYNELQNLVQNELLNLVKVRVESTNKGKELLGKQLQLIKTLKEKIINDTNIEMEMFKKFREYIKEHPNTTYDEFIKEGI